MNVSDPRITAEERAHVIELLRDTQAEFLALTTPLSDAQWSAVAGGWSVAHIAEHLVLGEVGMMRKIEQAMAAPAVVDWDSLFRKTRLLDRVLPDRSRKADAHTVLVPHGSWTREGCMARYRLGRAKTLRFAEETDLPLKAHASDHPFPVFNMLNAYQWLLYIPLHNLRHNQQIGEVLRAVNA